MKPFWSILWVYFLAIATGFSQGELLIPAGHNDAVAAVRYAPDGQLILSASRDHTLKLWDARSGLLIRTLYGHEGRILATAFSPSGKWILSSGKDAELNLWDSSTGEQLTSFSDIPSIVLSLAFIDEQSVLLGCMNGNILRLNLSSGRITYTLQQHQSPVGAIELLDSGTLISADWGGQLLLWNLVSRQVERAFEQGGKEVTCIAADQAGYFYTGDIAGKLKLWNSARENPEEIYDVQSEALLTVKVIPEHSYGTPVCAGKSTGLYIGTPTRKIRGFNLSKVSAHDNWVLGLDVSPDGRQLATCSWDGTIHIWNTHTQSFIQQLPLTAVELLSVSLSENERYALLGLKDGSIRFVDLSTGRQQYAFSNHLSWVTDVCFNPNLSGFASASLDNTVQIQRLGDKIPFQTFREDSGGIAALCYWPDGKKIGYAVGDTLRFRVIDSGTILMNIPVPSTSPVTTLDVSRTRGLILAVADSSAYVWDEEGRVVHQLTGHNLLVSDACFSKDGKFILTVSWDKTAVLWDVESGKPVQRFRAAAPLQAVAFSDGMNLLAASERGAIYQWQIGQPEALFQARAHQRPILGLAAGATTVLSISEDYSLKIWKTDGLEEVARFIPLTSERFLTVLPSGLYSCSKSRALLSQAGFLEQGLAYPLFLKDVQLNRPDQVAAGMIHPDSFLIPIYYNSYQKRLEKLSIPEEQFSPGFSPPQISIQNRGTIPVISNANTVTLHLSARDTIYGLGEVQVKNFGIPQWKASFSDLTNFWEEEVTVELAHGANEIEFSATNKQGLKAIPELLYLNNSSGKKQPNLYLLTIGMNEHAHSDFNLNYAAKDAKDITAAFQSNGQFKTAHSVSLTDQDVSPEGVRSALEAFKPAEVDDVVMVHYSGLGFLDDELNYYLSTYQTDFKHPMKESIAIDSLETWIENLKPLRKLLIIDACYSGEIDKEAMRGVLDHYEAGDEVKFRDAFFPQDTIPPLQQQKGLGLSNSFEVMNELFVDLRENGLFIIGSAHGNEYAMEGVQWRNSAFTFAFLSGLRNGTADINNDQVITLPEIFKYVYKTVPEITNFRQHPVWKGNPPRLDFPVWRVE